MCGRFTLRTPRETIADLFARLADSVPAPPDIEPRYNIAPTQPVLTVRQDWLGHGEWAQLRWGLVPHWAGDLRLGNRLINARVETVARTPAFREAFHERRCLVVADGFYEWPRIGDRKQPLYIVRRDQRPFCFAGVWERNTRIGAPVESCAIITTKADALMSQWHDRMPLILPVEHYGEWLDRQHADTRGLEKMLRSDWHYDFVAYPVSTAVNRATHDAPDCIEPLSITD